MSYNPTKSYKEMCIDELEKEFEIMAECWANDTSKEDALRRSNKLFSDMISYVKQTGVFTEEQLNLINNKMKRHFLKGVLKAEGNKNETK